MSSEQTHQSAGESQHSDRRLRRLRHIQQVIQQRLVLMMSEQIELIQHEQHGTTAALIT